jgi:5-deoxy-5-amino-3-dehydroquinate synthase
MRTVMVETPSRCYPVVVGAQARHELASVLPAGVRRAAVVTQQGIGVDVDPGVEHRRFVIGDGEDAKSLATVEDLTRQWARWGLTGADCVVAVGGGVVSDVAGFAAAVYHRGVEVVHVPTTLLGMVDAAIGGKTGVNLPEGKNLVGAFWQPSAVLCDIDVLSTLPPREWRSGCGEMAKYHFLTGDDLLQLELPERIARCVEIKGAVVAADEREDGRRAVLNYGHTLGHALEIAGHYDIRHGEAVGVGLVYAAHLAAVLGRISPARVDEHVSVVGTAYDLDTTMPARLDWEEVVALIGRDKKKKATDGFTFVLDGGEGVETVSRIERSALDAAYRAMTA